MLVEQVRGDAIVTGRHLGGDCTGAEKARRVRERYDLASYGEVFAYGDTEEDRDLFRLAGRRFFRGTEVPAAPARNAANVNR